MRKSNEQSLGAIIQEFLKVNRFEDKITEVKIHAAWAKVMGKQIDALTEKVQFRNNQLFVNLRSSALREELMMGRTKIIGLINTEIGKNAVKELILK